MLLKFTHIVPQAFKKFIMRERGHRENNEEPNRTLYAYMEMSQPLPRTDKIVENKNY
jgi:hypothetical protein